MLQKSSLYLIFEEGSVTVCILRQSVSAYIDTGDSSVKKVCALLALSTVLYKRKCIVGTKRSVHAAYMSSYCNMGN